LYIYINVMVHYRHGFASAIILAFFLRFGIKKFWLFLHSFSAG
jgi:hypothetical protein